MALPPMRKFFMLALAMCLGSAACTAATAAAPPPFHCDGQICSSGCDHPAAATILVLGPTGAGKSSLVNLLAGNRIARANPAMPVSVTENVTCYGFEAFNGKFPDLTQYWRVIDTPGLGDTSGQGMDERNLQNMIEMLRSIGEIDVVFVVWNKGRVPFNILLEFREAFGDLWRRMIFVYLDVIWGDITVEYDDDGFPAPHVECGPDDPRMWETNVHEILMNQAWQNLSKDLGVPEERCGTRTSQASDPCFPNPFQLPWIGLGNPDKFVSPRYNLAMPGARHYWDTIGKRCPTSDYVQLQQLLLDVEEITHKFLRPLDTREMVNGYQICQDALHALAANPSPALASKVAACLSAGLGRRVDQIQKVFQPDQNKQAQWAFALESCCRNQVQDLLIPAYGFTMAGIQVMTQLYPDYNTYRACTVQVSQTTAAALQDCHRILKHFWSQHPSHDSNVTQARRTLQSTLDGDIEHMCSCKHPDSVGYSCGSESMSCSGTKLCHPSSQPFGVHDDPCEERPTCSSFSCPTGQYQVQANRGRRCAGMTCNAQDGCCLPVAHCRDYRCPTDLGFTAVPTAVNVPCSGGVSACEMSTCCRCTHFKSETKVVFRNIPTHYAQVNCRNDEDFLTVEGHPDYGACCPIYNGNSCPRDKPDGVSATPGSNGWYRVSDGAPICTLLCHSDSDCDTKGGAKCFEDACQYGNGGRGIGQSFHVETVYRTVQVASCGTPTLAALNETVSLDLQIPVHQSEVHGKGGLSNASTNLMARAPPQFAGVLTPASLGVIALAAVFVVASASVSRCRRSQGNGNSYALLLEAA